MTREELLKKEAEAWTSAWTLIRAMKGWPAPSEAELDKHLKACEEYLDAGNEYDGPMTPFALGFKELEGKEDGERDKGKPV